MNHFDRLEKLAQHLIEGSFQRFFPAHVRLADLAEHLLAAVKNVEKAHQHDNGAATHYYQIMVNPVDYAGLVTASGRQALEVELYAYLASLSAEPLRVVLAENDAVEPGQVVIKADDMI